MQILALLLLALVVTSQSACAAVVTTGVPISNLPTTNRAPDSAWLITDQFAVGKLTNDTWKIAVSNLFNPRITNFGSSSNVLNYFYATNIYVTNLFLNGTNGANLGDLIWTNVGAYIAPVAFTNKLLITTNGSIWVGSTTRTAWGNDNDTLASIHDTAEGEPEYNNIFLSSKDTPNSLEGKGWLITHTNFVEFQLQHTTNDNAGTYDRFNLTVSEDPSTAAMIWTRNNGSTSTNFYVKGDSQFTSTNELFLSNRGVYTNHIETLVVTNLTVVSNIFASDLLWTNYLDGIAPVAFTDTFRLSTNGSVIIGKSADTVATPDAKTALAAVHDVALGEDPEVNLFLSAVDDAASTTNLAQVSGVTTILTSPTAQFVMTATSSNLTSSFTAEVIPESDTASLELISRGARSFYVASPSQYSDTGLLFLNDKGVYTNHIETLVVTNLTVVSNLIADLNWTNESGVLHPTDAAVYPMVQQGISVGVNTIPISGNPYPGTALVQTLDSALGDPSTSYITIDSIVDSDTYTDFGEMSQLVSTNLVTAAWSVITNNSNSAVEVNVQPSDPRLKLIVDSYERVRMQPSVPDDPADAAFTFGSSYTLTNAPLLRLMNYTSANLLFGPQAQITFGPGTTNVIYRSGSDLVYTNGNTGNARFSVVNGNNSGISLLAQGSSAGTVRTEGTATTLNLNNGTDIVSLFNNYFYPTVDASVSLGVPDSTRWNNLALSGTAYISGYLGAAPTNYARVAQYHTGTNGVFIIDSQSSGTAGDPRDIDLNFGGTNYFEFSYGRGSGAPIPTFSVKNSSGSAYLNLQLIGTSAPHIDASGPIYVDDQLVAKSIATATDNTYDIGSTAVNGAFKDFYQKGSHYVEKENDGSGNYSWLRVYTSGSNAIITPEKAGTGTAITVKMVWDAVANVIEAVGSGSPEGVLTAGIGSTYHRTDGGANTSFYVKESGTGNTGWVGK